MTLRMLRRTGCSLPVEVFVSSSEDAISPICVEMLNGLGARCVSMAASIGHIYENLELEQNRYLDKPLALVFSSFDDNLFLDSDNLPILDPYQLLEAEPYVSHGLIAWPDFWGSTISPKHAEITSTKLEPIQGTVESGQLLISKSLHAETLLLAFYYNFYGAGCYYLLESQGAVGFGDKETFLNAALTLNKPFYLVHEDISALGHWDAPEFVGPAMAQFDIIQDYQNYLNGALTVEDSQYKKPSILFVHHNMLKLNPDRIFGTSGHADYTRLSNGKWTRLWGPRQDTLDRFDGQDMEKIMWETLESVICGLAEKGLLVLNPDEGDSNSCELCHDYMNVVFYEENEES